MKNKYKVIVEHKQTRQVKVKEIILKPNFKRVTQLTKIETITLHPRTTPIRIPDNSFPKGLQGHTWKLKHTNKFKPRRQFQRHPHRIKPDIKRIAEIAYTIEDFTIAIEEYLTEIETQEVFKERR